MSKKLITAAASENSKVKRGRPRQWDFEDEKDSGEWMSSALSDRGRMEGCLAQTAHECLVESVRLPGRKTCFDQPIRPAYVWLLGDKQHRPKISLLAELERCRLLLDDDGELIRRLADELCKRRPPVKDAIRELRRMRLAEDVAGLSKRLPK